MGAHVTKLLSHGQMHPRLIDGDYRFAAGLTRDDFSAEDRRLRGGERSERLERNCYC